MGKHIIVTVLNLLLFVCPAISQKFEQQLHIKEFENQLVKDVSEDNIGSISAAIIINSKLAWSRAFGLANPLSGIYADTSTIYRIASISKTFTAFLMMQMIEKGYFKLDDSIEKYLPEIKGLIGYSDSTLITFRHLASHTSGLIKEPKLKNAADGPIEDWENKILLSIPTTSFQARPGIEYSYSNIGYGILGLAISRATNKSFIKLITDNIFVPLNMKNSFFIVPVSDTIRLSFGVGGNSGKKDIETPYRERKGRGYKVPNGGIYTTPNDLAKFVIALMGKSDKKIISDESRKLMQTICTPSDSRNGYGLGLNISTTDDDLIIIGHSGSIAGYSSYFCFDIKNGNAVILLRNYNSGKTDLELRSTILLEKLAKN
jgi:CubicO group peptidase (beta-lactamase class C family)